MIGQVVQDPRLLVTESNGFDIESGFNERETGFDYMQENNPFEQEYVESDQNMEFMEEDHGLAEDSLLREEQENDEYEFEEEANEFQMDEEQIRDLEDKGFNPEQIGEIKTQMQ